MNAFDFTAYETADLLTQVRVNGKFLQALSDCIKYDDQDEEYKATVLRFRNDVVDFLEAAKKELTARDVEFEDLTQPGKPKKSKKKKTEKAEKAEK